MSDREIKKITYECAKLGDTANLIVEYVDKDDAITFILFECENSRKCGIGKESPAGQWSFNWDICPGFKEVE